MCRGMKKAHKAGDTLCARTYMNTYMKLFGHGEGNGHVGFVGDGQADAADPFFLHHAGQRRQQRDQGLAVIAVDYLDMLQTDLIRRHVQRFKDGLLGGKQTGIGHQRLGLGFAAAPFSGGEGL